MGQDGKGKENRMEVIYGGTPLFVSLLEMLLTWQSSRMARASDSATFVRFRTNKLNQLKEVQEISKLNIEVLYSSSLDILSGPSKNSDKFVVRIENSQILQLQVISGRTNHIESDLLKFID